MGALNEAQLNILRALSVVKTPEDVEEIRHFVVKFLAKKLTSAVDRSVAEKGYTREEIAGWANEHFRLSNNPDESSN
jgi:hypothetical protein